MDLFRGVSFARCAVSRHRLRTTVSGCFVALIASMFLIGSQAAGQASGPGDGPEPVLAPGESRALSAVKTHRLIEVFNFDDVTNPDPVPSHWFRAQDNPASGFSRPGFPSHNQAELDSSVHRSGAAGGASVRLPTRGGSTSLRLASGQVAVFADADYLVTGEVLTSALNHARAFVIVRLLDQQNQPIDGAEFRTPPIVSPSRWESINLKIPGRFKNAAWLQIDLELAQPRQFQLPPSEPLASHHIWREDVSGAAWFDDIGVYQVPRAQLTIESKGGVVLAPEAPVFSMRVRDLAGQALDASVSVRDLDGVVVATHTTQLDPGGRVESWSPPLTSFGWYSATMDVQAQGTPVSRAEARLLYLPARSPASQAQDSTAQDVARFGLIAENASPATLEVLPEIVQKIGSGFVTLPAFEASMTRANTLERTRARSSLYERLLDHGQEITLSIAQVPSELRDDLKIDSTDALAMASNPPTAWLPYLSPTLDIHGQRVRRFQLGAVGDEHVFRSELAKPLSSFERTIARLVPGPILALPWRSDQSLPRVDRVEASAENPTTGTATKPVAKPVTNPGAQPGPDRNDPVFPKLPDIQFTGPVIDALTLVYPSGFPAPGIAALSRAAAANPPTTTSTSDTPPDREQHPELTIVPELPDPTLFGERAGVIELVKRATYFWQAFADNVLADDSGSPTDDALARTNDSFRPARLAIWHPFLDSVRGAPLVGAEPEDVGREIDLTEVRPTPALGVLRTLVSRLSGRRIVGELPAPKGVVALILAGRDPVRGTLDRGCVIAWNQSALPGDANIDVAASGRGVVVVDPFGNERFIEIGPTQLATAGPLVNVRVGETPVFIEGVDAYLAMFASSIRLDPRFIPSVVTQHDHRLSFTNPWPVRISGQLQLKERVTDGSQGREWTISPRGVIEFVAAPGERVTIPVALSFGPGQPAGEKEFLVIAKVLADRQYPPLRLRTSVEVGLTTIELSPEVSVGPGIDGPDVYVIATITNRDTRSRTLRLEAVTRGVPTQQLQISDLPPGETIYRRFVFRNASAALSGKRIAVSVSDVEAAERLNRSVQVP